MATILSVNVGAAEPTRHSPAGTTGIRKRPVNYPVSVSPPGKRGHSGLAEDHVCDARHHGGPDQAVYAYASEDLAAWSTELDRALSPGSFGENLTTAGLDMSATLIGTQWRVGESLVLEVSCPRIPCRTFAGEIGLAGWVKTFTERAKPGAYCRVVTAGPVRRGDPVALVHNPLHDVTIELAFRALTSEPELLPTLVAADALAEADMRKARAYVRAHAG